MTERRNFIKTSALGILSSSLAFIPTEIEARSNNSSHIVKQPEDCETFYIRENTPITFHISKITDNVKAISICTEEIQPGGAIPTHKHIHAEEYFYFVSGTGIITCNDIETPFKAGTTALVPRNTWHGIKNTGSEIVHMLFGFSPAGFEDFFRQIGTPKGQPFKQKPKEEFDSICRKFGMVFK